MLSAQESQQANSPPDAAEEHGISARAGHGSVEPESSPEAAKHEQAQRVALLMKQLHRLASSEIMRDLQSEVQESELSFSQVAALYQLRAYAPMSVTQLAERTHLSLSAASHLVDRLVKRQLMSRQENPENRREKLLILAPEGSALVSRMDQRYLDAYTSLFAQLSRQQLENTEKQLTLLLQELAPSSFSQESI